MSFHILVVCTGNICRSPMGEIVLQERLRASENPELQNIMVSSAGVSAEESGNSIDRRAAKVLQEAGYSLPKRHYAHRVTREEMQKADLILAMTRGHAAALRRYAENYEVDTAKIKLWQEFTGEINPDYLGSYDVPDPWYGSEDGFYGTLETVEKGAAGIRDWLEENL